MEQLLPLGEFQQRWQQDNRRCENTEQPDDHHQAEACHASMARRSHGAKTNHGGQERQGDGRGSCSADRENGT